MSDQPFTQGQRWLSVAEPELGLGEVRTTSARAVTIWFAAAQETRTYAVAAGLPLRRAAFHVGDAIDAGARGRGTITSATERDGLFYYGLGAVEVCETALSPHVGFSSPLRRLAAAQVDASHLFDHRLAALRYQHARRRSEVRGLVGARIDLLPHQLGIAADVSNRLIPRVLLADEVGLGKTIEACLIVQRLVATGRAQRVLILAPEALVSQWFLELLRRFNLWFHIYTEARCAAIEEANAGVNPFGDDQLVLADLGLLVRDPHRLSQALDAGWDMVVVDEAHHLRWSPAEASPEYAAVDQLARAAAGLLLLTATPEQLGQEGHFARLRLLDPDRFPDLDRYRQETAGYQEIAALADRLRGGERLDAADAARLAGVLQGDRERVAAVADGHDTAARVALLDRLLDQHGTSRVMLRNTRATVTGFPARRVVRHTLGLDGRRTRESLADEWESDSGSAGGRSDRWLASDPRIAWLVALLQTLDDQKLLLLCTSPRKVRAIEAALRAHTSLPAATFHEELSLVQRDRAAAWFADPDGARLLVASEIGSEGRNFQFAHHLVLFDLPLDPALLEQRIGRLDRIGQHHEISIHVPVVPGSHLEVLARWYHDGLDAFEHHLPGARELMERFEPRLRALAARARTGAPLTDDLSALVADTRRARDEVVARLEAGRDRLLEWNSARPAWSARIIDLIRAQDADRGLDDFLLRTFDLFLVEVEELAPRTFRLGSAGVLVDDFPGLTGDHLVVTRDRARALVRDDVQFLTWDHPLATGALDLLLGSETGNCAFAHWIDKDASTVYIETVFVLECLAPAALHADRFLPPTPIALVVDRHGREVVLPPRAIDAQASRAGLAAALLSRPEVRDQLLPRLVEQARQAAEVRAGVTRTAARTEMHERVRHEAARLRDLQRVNPLVREEEIVLRLEQARTLDAVIASARIRLDAVRLIYRGPERERS